MYKKKRIIYTILFLAVLLIEIAIALFLKTGFIRAYVGDALVTVLLCALVKSIFPNSKQWVPLCVFFFAVLVEFMQYIDVVKLLHLQNSNFLSTLCGRTFSVLDLACYAVGCILFCVFDSVVFKRYQ